MQRIGLIALCALALAGCVTVPRNEATALADAGKQAAIAFRGQLTELRVTLDRASWVNAFVQTYEPCDAMRQVALAEARRTGRPAPAAEPCEVAAEQPESLLAARERLSSAISQRELALTALEQAYISMAAEAQYDAATNLAGATKTLVESSEGALTAIAALTPDAGAVTLRPLTALAPRVAGWLAADAQKGRLRQASVRIGAAAFMLEQELARERTVYVGFAQDFAEREAAYGQIMISSGMTPRLRLIEPTTTAMGYPLVSNAETVINNNQFLQASIAAAERENARRRIRLIDASYSASLRLMTRLAEAHRNFERDREPGIADLTRGIQELTAIVTELRAISPPATPTPTPTPTPPAPGRTP